MRGWQGFDQKNLIGQDAIPAHGWRFDSKNGIGQDMCFRAWLAAFRHFCRKDYVLKNGYGQDKLGHRRCFAAPGACRHARAVYELAHNPMWLDMARRGDMLNYRELTKLIRKQG